MNKETTDLCDKAFDIAQYLHGDPAAASIYAGLLIAKAMEPEVIVAEAPKTFEEERTAFEQWCIINLAFNTKRESTGQFYEVRGIQYAWEAWAARAGLNL